MVVERDCQRQGLGGRILSFLEQRAAEGGATYVVLNAREEAASFYRRHGYTEVGSAGCLFGSIPHIRMRKLLTATTPM